jgi:hypothetical protein
MLAVATRLVELEIVDSVSHEAVHRALKKRALAIDHSYLARP